jgi:hypothetical protein
VAHLPGITLAHLPGITLAHLPGITVAHLPGITLAHLPGITVAHLPGITVAHLPGIRWLMAKEVCGRGASCLLALTLGPMTWLYASAAHAAQSCLAVRQQSRHRSQALATLCLPSLSSVPAKLVISACWHGRRLQLVMHS